MVLFQAEEFHYSDRTYAAHRAIVTYIVIVCLLDSCLCLGRYHGYARLCTVMHSYAHFTHLTGLN